MAATPWPPPPVLDQLALATFIDRGCVDATCAARRRFGVRRDLLVRTLAAVVPRAGSAGTAARCTSCYAYRRTDTPPARFGPRLPLAWRPRRLPRSRSSGARVVLGYGDVDHTEIPAVALLREALLPVPFAVTGTLTVEVLMPGRLAPGGRARRRALADHDREVIAPAMASGRRRRRRLPAR